MGPEF